MTSKILLVDDDSEAVLSLSRALKAYIQVPVELSIATGVEKGLAMAVESKPQVAILDLCIDESIGVESGFSLLKKIKKEVPSCTVLMLTGHGAKENGIKALQIGATSFLEKPADVPHLAALVEEGIRQSKLRISYEDLKVSYSDSWQIPGVSEAAEKLREQIKFAATTKQAILLEGETGTGKSYCARMIHALSTLKTKNFLRYQPGQAGSDIVGSDLFGHVKGSFTGADQDRKGIIESVAGGTLFIDEIDELPHKTQVSLLTVLQDKKLRALGSNKEIDVDFRLVTASNANLDLACEEGKVRKDFFHRIAHSRITIPPLRERLDDMEALLKIILSKLSLKEGVQINSWNQAVLQKLKSYNWPGNIRELHAVVENAAYHARYKDRYEIIVEDISVNSTSTDSASKSLKSLVKQYKKELVVKALDSSENNQVKAAKSLGIDRSTLRRIIEEKV